MQFAIGVTVLKCSFVKHSHGPLGVKSYRIYVFYLGHLTNDSCFFHNDCGGW
jgi:hypothetical protein